MKTSPPNKSFSQLLTSGILGWIAATAALVAAAWFLADQESANAPWSPSYGWWAYGLGGVALLVRAVFLRKSPLAALTAYLLPVGLLAVAGGLCLWIYPDPGFREEFFAYAPALLVFYVFGVLWMRLRSGTGGEFLRAVLPPIIGGFLMLAFVAVPVFTGNAFRYRDAFALEVISQTQRDGSSEADAVIEIRKPGSYEFSIPMYPMFALGPGPDFDPKTANGEIIWGAGGKPKDGVPGRYPLKIRWKVPVIESGMPPMPGLEKFVAVEIREAGNPGVVAAMVFAPVEVSD